MTSAPRSSSASSRITHLKASCAFTPQRGMKFLGGTGRCRGAIVEAVDVVTDAAPSPGSAAASAIERGEGDVELRAGNSADLSAGRPNGVGLPERIRIG